ncbi:MAG: PrsW family intramembrane metalloprotease [Treponema sp.]|jgi:RsiW-degrading membrane proteinase PrsW (M82 family)|nr:PrsW family intramembrane metalloprotease [Treponema sp.]
MKGLWALLLLISFSALPVLAVYIWIRFRKFPMGFPWFLAALLSGAFSLGAAALIQSLFPSPEELTLRILLAKIFLQIALTEELARLGVLLLLFWLARRFSKHRESLTPAFGTATGLIAGLGFAVIETAFYGAANFSVALIRAVTAAPLHGACGARIGLGAVNLKKEPFLAVLRFFYAVIIHGMYNFMLVSPSVPVIFPILIALTALISSIQALRT